MNYWTVVALAIVASMLTPGTIGCLYIAAWVQGRITGGDDLEPDTRTVSWEARA